MSYSNGLLHSSSPTITPQRGLPGVGFELTDDGNYDMDAKRLTDLAEPVDGKDATTKAYVDEKTSHNTSNLYHLRQSFEFYDSSGTKLALSTDNITGLLSDYKYGYYKIAKGGDEITYSYVLLKIKNNLPQSTYSALFHMYGYKNNKIITGLDLGPILYVSDPENYHILKFDDDDSLDTRHDTKGIIWFTADGNGSFNIELRFWDKSITHFVVLSRCVEGEVNLGFRIDIFNVPHNSSSTFYFEDINMNGRKIKIVGDPTDDGDGTNKKYVDTANSKQDIAIADKANKSYVDGEIAKVNIDTTPLLPRNGSRTMTGDLDMGGFDINNVKTVVEDDGENPNYDQIKYKAVNFEFVKNMRDYLVLTNAEGEEDLLPRDGSESMQGDLNMANHSIIDLKDPQASDASYAASVNFVHTTINGSNTIINGVIDTKIKASEERSIQAVQQENVFKKVMRDDLFIIEDDDIHKVAVVDKDFHKVNQQTYQFKIDYDSSIGYYSTGLGVNIVYLPIGYYTIVFEMYFSNKIDPDKININASSGTLSVNKINTKKSSNHTRSVINFYKAMIHHSDDELEIDFSLKNKAGQSYDVKTNIYVVVYGVSGSQNDVSTQLWDRSFYIDYKKIHFKAPIDMVNKNIENVNDLSINNELNMNNRQIKNVGDGNENADAVNVKQLNETETNIANYVTGEFGKVNPVLSNNSDLIKFIYRNLIRNDSKSLLIKELYFPDSVEGRTQNNYTYHTNFDNKGDITFYLTFVHKATTSDDMVISIYWEGLTDNFYILVSKDKVVASINFLINEANITSYKIPSYFQGKQLYLWITIQNDVIKIFFSGLSRAISATHPNLINNDRILLKFNVSDSPFTIQRGLITKNIYDQNSDAYKDVREYEISEGTFIGAS